MVVASVAYSRNMGGSADNQWWWVPLFSGLPAFFGGLVAVWISTRQERRRLRQEEQKRWHSDRVGAYNAFVFCARAFGEAVLLDWGSDKGAFHYGDPLRHFMNAWSTLNLVGSDQIKSQAGVIYTLFERAFYHRELSPHGRQSFRDALGGSINAFIGVARKELGA